MSKAVVHPKVTVKKPRPDKLKQIQKAIKLANGSYVQVGWFDEKTYPDGTLVSQVAIWNEYGTKKSSQYPDHRPMPARPFIRPAMENNKEELEKVRVAAIQMAAFEGIPVSQALGTIGMRVQEMIRNAIKANPGPALSPRTIAHKIRHGRPRVSLIDTRLMLDSLSYKVVLSKQLKMHEDQVRENRAKAQAARQKKYEQGAEARARARAKAQDEKKKNAERRAVVRQAKRAQAKKTREKAKAKAKAAKARSKTQKQKQQARAKAIAAIKDRASRALGAVAKVFSRKSKKTTKKKGPNT